MRLDNCRVVRFVVSALTEEKCGEAKVTTPILQNRRSFLSAVGIILAAPAIVRAPGLLMSVPRTHLAVGTVISGAGIAAGTTITASASGLAFSETDLIYNHCGLKKIQNTMKFFIAMRDCQNDAQIASPQCGHIPGRRNGLVPDGMGMDSEYSGKT